MIDISLNNVCVRQRSRSRERSLDSGTQVDTDDVASAPASRELRVPAFTATSFEDNLVAKKLGSDGCDPTEILFRVLRVLMCEVLPLPAKVRRCLAFFALKVLEIGETRNAGSYWK